MTVTFGISLGGGFPMRDYIWMGQLAEHYGIDEIVVGDDLILRPAWPILTLLAEHTKTVRLGPGVISASVAHPIYHAINLAALDELSGGRAMCAVAKGGFNELIGQSGTRGLRFIRETVEIMRNVLAGRRGEYRGDFFTYSADFVLDFEPLRSDVPIYVGTWGPQTARLAGSFADGIKVNCVASPHYLEQLVGQVRAGAARTGRPGAPYVSVAPLSSISADRGAAIHHAKEKLAVYLPLLAPLPEFAGVSPEESALANRAYLDGDLARAAGLVSQTTVDAMAVAGNAADVIPKYEQLIKAGATNISFSFTGDRGPSFAESMAEIGEKVIPYLRSIA